MIHYFIRHILVRIRTMFLEYERVLRVVRPDESYQQQQQKM